MRICSGHRRAIVAPISGGSRAFCDERFADLEGPAFGYGYCASGPFEPFEFPLDDEV
jgi:hypothetical protein